MLHHGLGVDDCNAVVHCPCLKGVERQLKWCVVRRPVVDGDAHDAEANILSVMQGVHAGVVDEHQKGERVNFIALWDPHIS